MATDSYTPDQRQRGYGAVRKIELLGRSYERLDSDIEIESTTQGTVRFQIALYDIAPSTWESVERGTPIRITVGWETGPSRTVFGVVRSKREPSIVREGSRRYVLSGVDTATNLLRSQINATWRNPTVRRVSQDIANRVGLSTGTLGVSGSRTYLPETWAVTNDHPLIYWLDQLVADAGKGSQSQWRWFVEDGRLSVGPLIIQTPQTVDDGSTGRPDPTVNRPGVKSASPLLRSGSSSLIAAPTSSLYDALRLTMTDGARPGTGIGNVEGDGSRQGIDVGRRPDSPGQTGEGREERVSGLLGPQSPNGSVIRVSPSIGSGTPTLPGQTSETAISTDDARDMHGYFEPGLRKDRAVVIEGFDAGLFQPPRSAPGESDSRVRTLENITGSTEARYQTGSGAVPTPFIVLEYSIVSSSRTGQHHVSARLLPATQRTAQPFSPERGIRTDADTLGTAASSNPQSLAINLSDTERPEPFGDAPYVDSDTLGNMNAGGFCAGGSGDLHSTWGSSGWGRGSWGGIPVDSPRQADRE